MNILIAIGIAFLAIFVLVGLLKLAFTALVLGAVIAIGIGAYVAVTKKLGQGR